MSVKIKICGVTRAEDGLVAAELGAWAVGMVFAPNGPRTLTCEQGARIVKALPAGVLKVGVFLDQSYEEIHAIDQSLGLDLIQLHGAESDLFCRKFAKDRVIKAVVLSGRESLQDAAAREARYVLADRPRSVPGEKKTVDWEVAAQLAAAHPRTLLAGALEPGNVAAAVRKVRPFAVDVSSGIERRPGVKDKAVMADFFKAVQETER